MAFIFLFFSCSILLSALKALWIRFGFNDFYLSSILSVLFVIYGTFEAKNITIENVKIYSDKIKKGESIKVVQISDVHLGIILKDSFTKKVVSIVEELKPDILVATGDLVDGQSNDISHLAKYFENVRPPLGKFAILGNHEFYVGVQNSLSFLEKAGFFVLRNKSVKVGENLILAGVDDDVVSRYGEKKYLDELSVLKEIDSKKNFIIFLKHKPTINKESLNYFDLQLSGHTHRGQIFPFTLIVKIFFPIKTGLSAFEKDGMVSYLYSSRGTGTWGPPVRLLARPEVTLIEIMSK